MPHDNMPRPDFYADRGTIVGRLSPVIGRTHNDLHARVTPSRLFLCPICVHYECRALCVAWMQVRVEYFSWQSPST